MNNNEVGFSRRLLLMSCECNLQASVQEHSFLRINKNSNFQIMLYFVIVHLCQLSHKMSNRRHRSMHSIEKKYIITAAINQQQQQQKQNHVNSSSSRKQN